MLELNMDTQLNNLKILILTLLNNNGHYERDI